MPLNITILHNPRCSKSRQTLALLEEAGAEVTVVSYLQDPLDAAALDEVCTKLSMEPEQLIRWGDAAKAGISRPEVSSRSGWLAFLEAHPKLMQRPVVIRGGRAVLGRPPENVHVLLD